MKSIGLAAILACTILSCTTSDILRLDQIKRSPKQASEIQILLNEPKSAYQGIALVEVSDEGMGASLEQLKNKMVADAAQLGGDAVIIGRESEEEGSSFTPVGKSWVATTYNKKKLIGKVIVFQKSNE